MIYVRFLLHSIAATCKLKYVLRISSDEQPTTAVLIRGWVSRRNTCLLGNHFAVACASAARSDRSCHEHDKARCAACRHGNPMTIRWLVGSQQRTDCSDSGHSGRSAHRAAGWTAARSACGEPCQNGVQRPWLARHLHCGRAADCCSVSSILVALLHGSWSACSTRAHSGDEACCSMQICWKARAVLNRALPWRQAYRPSMLMVLCA